MIIDVVVTLDNTEDIKAILNEIQKESVYLGVPEEKSSRNAESVTNAELAFLHTNGVRSSQMRNEMDDTGLPYSQAMQAFLAEHGSPLWRVPPRPIIQPAIEDEENMEMIKEQMKAVLDAFIKSKTKGAEELEKLGLMGQNILRDWFDNPKNNWAPNSPYTIAIKEEKGSTDPKPLIDTGQLRKSMTYVIRKEGE